MVAGENILSIYLQTKYQQPIRRYICPICAYPLIETEKGLFCRWDGWKENETIRFIPRTPENKA
jgi:hypothetical protein